MDLMENLCRYSRLEYWPAIRKAHTRVRSRPSGAQCRRSETLPEDRQSSSGGCQTSSTSHTATQHQQQRCKVARCKDINTAVPPCTNKQQPPGRRNTMLLGAAVVVWASGAFLTPYPVRSREALAVSETVSTGSTNNGNSSSIVPAQQDAAAPPAAAAGRSDLVRPSAPALPASPSAQARGAEPADIAAVTVEKAYDQYAGDYDVLDGGGVADRLGFPQMRAKLLSRASGNVLEVAVGTGLNLRHYDWSRVSHLTALDLSAGMLRQAMDRLAEGGVPLAGRPIKFLQGDVTRLPFPDASFDTCVDTFSLCVFVEPRAALAEVTRVLKPGGRALLIEHSKSDNPLLGLYQDATASAVANMSKGCSWNQDVEQLVKSAGLNVVRLERFTGGTISMIEAVKQP